MTFWRRKATSNSNRNYMFEIFRNGSAVVNRRLMLIELGLSSLLMAIVLIQGYLPSQDWIKPEILKPLAFLLGVSAALLKASEMFFSKAASMYAQDKDREAKYGTPSKITATTETTETTTIEKTDMNITNKVTGLLVASALFLAASASAQVSTNGPAGSFFNTVGSYFTSFNPTLTNTFNAKASIWTGMDSLSGNKASLANEIGVAYNVYRPIDIESVTRDGGVTGTLVSQSIGVNANFKIIDTRLTIYADAGYTLDSLAGTKFQDNLFGEVGLRVSKALTDHTYAWVGLGVQFPNQARVFSGGVGFTF